MSKLKIDNTEITVLKIDDMDYISLTDMIKAKDGDFFIADWLRNRNTVEFLGVWEQIHNPDFNYGEFAIIKSQAGLNNYKISVKDLARTCHRRAEKHYLRQRSRCFECSVIWCDSKRVAR